MKNTRIELSDVALPYSGGAYLLSSGREYQSFDTAIVRLTTDAAIQGWGESTLFGSTYSGACTWGACGHT